MIVLPAAKAAIIVGGVAIAAGIALYEHAPFREWCDETWKNTTEKWKGLVDEAGKRQRAKEAPMGVATSQSKGATTGLELKRRRSSSAMKRSTASIDDALQMAQDAEAILFEGRNGTGARFGSVRRRRAYGSIGRDPFADTQSAHGSMSSATTASRGLHTPTSESGASIAHSEDYWGTHTIDAREADMTRPVMTDEPRTIPSPDGDPLNSNPISMNAISHGQTPLTAQALHSIARDTMEATSGDNYTVNRPASFYSVVQEDDIISHASSKTLSHVSVDEQMLRTPNSSIADGEERYDVLSVASSGWSEVSGQSGSEH